MRAADVLAAGTTPLTAPAFTPGSHRFTTTPTGWACSTRSSSRVSRALVPISAGVRSDPRSTSKTGAPRFTAIVALKSNSVGLGTPV